MRKIKNRIRKVAMTVLGTTILVGGLFLVGCVETETLMSPTYETVGVVMNNKYVSRNNWIVSVNVDGEEYTYYATSPEKLLSEITLEMRSKGTLKKSDDEIIDAY